MTDWAASFSTDHHRIDRMGWVASAAAVVLLLAATTAIAMRLQTAEGLDVSQADAILLDMQPLPPAPAITAMAEPAPDGPMTDAPDGLPSPQMAADPAPQPTSVPEPDAPAIQSAPLLPVITPDTINTDASLPPPPPPPKAKPAPKPVPKAAQAPTKDATTAEVSPEPQPNEKPAATAKSASAPPPSKASTAPRAASPAVETGTAKVAVPKGRVKDLVARWGASIRARVERRNAYPKSAKGRVGSVTLQLVVTRSGTLKSVKIAGSSGASVLDAAALQAVKRAGKFDAAPKDLTDASYGFTLQLAYSK